MSAATDEQSTVERVFGPPADDTQPKPFRLSDFEGLAVTKSGIEIPDAAGGLRDALDVDPIELHKADYVDIVLRCQVAKIRHDPIDKNELDGEQCRVHVLKTTQATIIDHSVVVDALNAQEERIEKAKSDAKQLEGQQTLDDATVEPPTNPPLVGYDDFTADEIIERVTACSDDDVDMVDAIERWEEANGGRATVLAAIKKWRDG